MAYCFGQNDSKAIDGIKWDAGYFHLCLACAPSESDGHAIALTEQGLLDAPPAESDWPDPPIDAEMIVKTEAARQDVASAPGCIGISFRTKNAVGTDGSRMVTKIESWSPLFGVIDVGDFLVAGSPNLCYIDKYGYGTAGIQLGQPLEFWWRRPRETEIHKTIVRAVAVPAGVA